MLQILKASKSNPSKPFPPEIKEYISQVEVVHLENKGRGLRAQQDFDPGDLIMAQKALAIILPDPESSTKSFLLNKVKRFRLLKEAVGKLLTLPNSAYFEPKISSLHAGPKLGYLKTDPIINGSVKTKVSASRIEGILIVNGFEGQSREALEGPFGLWYLPSFLNHDCFKTNANWDIYNDFMLIRATKLIRKGEEILIREGIYNQFLIGDWILKI